MASQVGGGTAVDGVRALALHLAGQINVTHGGSVVGVVTFNDSATVAQPLTNDAATVAASIDAYGTASQPVSGGTNIGAALDAARGMLTSFSEPSVHQRVAIAITDGEQNEAYGGASQVNSSQTQRPTPNTPRAQKNAPRHHTL